MSLGKKKMLSQGAAGGVVASDNINVKLYTGDGTTGRVIQTGLDADLVIIKNRSSAQQDWIWIDSVRGASNYIRSNSTSQEHNAGSGQGVSAFGTGTVTIGDNSDGNLGVNGTDGGEYSGTGLHVMYTFKGGGAKASNTAGTIASEVSANVDAGFSIVSFTSNGVGSPVSTGHGLSSVPELVIFKNRDDTSQWPVFHKDIGFNGRLQLEDSASISTFTPFFDITTTTIAIRQSSLAINGDKCIAYCFHSVDGYSKIGSYTGQTNGVTIETGFQPRFIMVKSSSNVENWAILDTVRGSGKVLNPNRLNAETDSTLNTFTVSSTGFSFPNQSTADAMLNENGYEYIYMAIA